MDVFGFENYRTLLRSRVKELSAQRSRYNLKYFAQKIPLQYTYLSKCLGDTKAHLSEDHLQKFCELLQFLPSEVDYIFLLRAHAVCQTKNRRDFLSKKIARIQKANRLAATVDESKGVGSSEVDYLLSPLAVLTHVALAIAEYKKNPNRLAGHLGVSVDQLQGILQKLHHLDYLELDAGGKQVKAIKNAHVHFSTEHPLMRVHQSLLKTLSAGQILKTEERDKYQFMVSFAGDGAAMKKIQSAFEDFIRKAERIALGSEKRHVFQLNFDLFRWF